MICPQCHTSNPPENKFCRECGHVLATPVAVAPAPPEVTPVDTTPIETAATVTAIESASVSEVAAEAPTLTPAALAEAMAAAVVSRVSVPPPPGERSVLAEPVSVQERAAQLLAESASLEQRGWLADATARAEKAAALLPDSNMPLSTLVRLYEAQGDRDKALVMQGHIVRRSPELRAEREVYDRMQQEAVRAAVADAPVAKSTGSATQAAPQQKDKAQPPPYVPLAVAGGVAALVFCVGVSLWGKHNTGPQITETTLPAYNNVPLNAPPPVSSAPSALGMGTDAALAARPTPSTADVRTDPFIRQRPDGFGTPAAPGSGFTPPTRRSVAPDNTRSGPRASSLPLPSLSAPGQVGSNGPVRFVAPASVTVDGAPNAGFGNGARVPAKPPTETGGEPTAPGNSAPEDPGYIRIQVRPGTNPPPPENPGTGEGGNNSNGSDAAISSPANLSALERARRLQDQGRYPEAIAAYQEAIRLTPMASGGTYQGLAQSYQRAGDVSAARSNYQVAIRSYEAEISAGQRSPVAVRGLATCRAALEVLGG